jgi:hypothetical protein
MNCLCDFALFTLNICNASCRYYGVNDPVADKMLARAAERPKMTPPADIGICTLFDPNHHPPSTTTFHYYFSNAPLPLHPTTFFSLSETN